MKGTVMAYFKGLFQHLPEGTKANHIKLQKRSLWASFKSGAL